MRPSLRHVDERWPPQTPATDSRCQLAGGDIRQCRISQPVVHAAFRLGRPRALAKSEKYRPRQVDCSAGPSNTDPTSSSPCPAKSGEAAMEFVDRLLTCADCGGEFIFTAGEQLFFFDKQFKNDPKRCKPCKSKRAGAAARAVGAGPAAAGISRTETRTTCSECGIETTVPFKPTQGTTRALPPCFQNKRVALPVATTTTTACLPGHRPLRWSPQPQRPILPISAEMMAAAARAPQSLTAYSSPHLPHSRMRG